MEEVGRYQWQVITNKDKLWKCLSQGVGRKRSKEGMEVAWRFETEHKTCKFVR